MISEESLHLDEELTEASRELRKVANGVGEQMHKSTQEELSLISRRTTTVKNIRYQSVHRVFATRSEGQADHVATTK